MPVATWSSARRNEGRTMKTFMPAEAVDPITVEVIRNNTRARHCV